MKIKTKNMPYETVMALPRPKHRKPLRPMWLLTLVVRILSIFDLLPTKFTYEKHGMDKLDPKEPVLILMNHSCFLDLMALERMLNAFMYLKMRSRRAIRSALRAVYGIFTKKLR